MEGWARAAFAAMRPPGHHAERARPMGFCLFNGAAIAALHARARWGLRRVAVVDFDVHHGNGTQDIFETRPGPALRQQPPVPLLPRHRRRGRARRRGERRQPAAPPRLRQRRLPRRLGAPGPARAATRSAPELLIVSAGFDAHRADPLADLRLETADFGWITDQLLAVADACCGGKARLGAGGRLRPCRRSPPPPPCTSAGSCGNRSVRASHRTPHGGRHLPACPSRTRWRNWNGSCAAWRAASRSWRTPSAAYERGAALRRHCEAKLAEAEARVQAIVERADGSLGLKAEG